MVYWKVVGCSWYLLCCGSSAPYWEWNTVDCFGGLGGKVYRIMFVLSFGLWDFEVRMVVLSGLRNDRRSQRESRILHNRQLAEPWGSNYSKVGLMYVSPQSRH